MQPNYSRLPESASPQLRIRAALSQSKQNIENNPIWQPAPANQPQQMAYDLALSGKVKQIGYGGQPHGGKTELALGLSSVFPDAKIFRRTFRAMTKMIERGNTIYPARYVAGRKSYWRWPGHLVELAHMQHEKDWEHNQGQPSSLMVFDEAAQFTETMVRTVGGWLRTTAEGQHTLLLLCFNPPTKPEGEWIVKFFAPWIDPEYPGKRAEPGEIRWFVNLGGKDTETPNGDPLEHKSNGKTLKLYPVSRTFVPASRHDNPYHTIEYEQALSALPEPLRTIMMNADFSVNIQDDDWQAIPSAWLLAAQERGRTQQKPESKLRAVGVDVAHGGNDCTAIAKLYENWFDDLIIYEGHQTPDGKSAAHYVIQSMESFEAGVFVDGIGYGASCADVLNETDGVNSHAINFGAGSNARDKSGIYPFANVRAAAYWALREALDPASGENICLPDDRDLRVELAAPRYNIVGGKIQIEPKKDIAKRLGRSPDRADAVVLAWNGASVEKPASITYLD